MGDDDDADCVEHVWDVAELDFSLEHGVRQVSRCRRCPAVAYVPDPARSPRRPPLT